MRTSLGKLKRSGVYYLMTTIDFNDGSRTARRDTWGAALVVALLLGGVGLMRLVLTA